MRQSSEQRKLLTEAMERYAEHLDEALPYLESRGFDRQSASIAGLGVVRNPILGHEKRVGRLAIPYQTKAGVVAFNFRCFRCAEGCVGHPKYLVTAGADSLMFNVEAAHADTLDMHICEGEIDTLTLDALVGIPAMGFPGATKWAPHWKEVLADFRRIVVVCDGDSAGSGLGRKLQKELGARVDLVQMPEGQDINSVYVKLGADGVRTLIGMESK